VKKLSKQNALRMNLIISEFDPTLGILLKISDEVKSLDNEILSIYCPSRESPKAEIDKLIAKLEALLELAKGISGKLCG
jgi:hypothetical protein